MDYEFEFDPSKSQANKAKHGIGFFEAQRFWTEGRVLVLTSDFEAEERWFGITRYHDRYWTAVFTLLEEKIRLISVRRSRKNEIEFYKENSG